jgi:alanine-synthesizing transaminase
MFGDLRSDRLPPYPLGELTEAIRVARLSGVDVIDFSQINPDSGAPSVAVDKAIQSLLLTHHHRYSSSSGISSLRKKFVKFYQDRFSAELDHDRECLVTMGVKEGLGHMLLAIAGAGDQVMTVTPSYPVHPAAVFLAGATSIPVSLYDSWEEAEETEYKLTENSDVFFKRLQQLYEHAWPRPRAFILSFPHNPTTTTVTQGFFARLVEFAKNTGLYLLHDFAHAEVYRDKADAPSLLSIPGAKDCSVEFYSLSKSFQMPGWRVGFAVGNEQLISGLRRVKSYLDFGVFQPLQLGTQAALDHGLVTVEEARLLYNDRRETLESGLNNLGWTVAPGRGSVFMWAKLPKTYQGEGAQKFSNLAVSKAGVAISPGSGFDLGADQFCRFALGETESRIREGLKRLEKLG